MKKPVFGLVILFFSMFMMGTRLAPAVTGAAVLQDSPAVDQAVEAAVMNVVEQNRLSVLGFLLFQIKIDHIQYSSDGQTALVWLAMVDEQTGEVIAAEPGLSIARNLQGDPTLSQSWSVTLNSAEDWQLQLANLPADLLTDDIRMRYLFGDIGIAVQAIDNSISLSGYKLPWAAGLEKRLTGSLGHIYDYKSCENSCRYAFDFADGTMFPLLAAKGGSVKQFKWSCANGVTTCTNYLILEDQSTSPVSYQVYYHLAYDSIPARLRTNGARVMQGEFIGNVDDTGASSGHHLHYHVYAIPSWLPSWEWGKSVDITFDDVPINGGRPRTCSEASRFPNEGGGECMVGKDGKKFTSDDDRFLSGNVGAYPPVGDISSPLAGFVNSASTMTVTGFSSDDQGVTKVQVLGYFGGIWNNLGDATLKADGSFSKSIDICQSKIPYGDFSLALRIFDREGNQAPGYPGLRVVRNQLVCYTPPPPPVCSPGANEVALYATTDFLGSACKKFPIGSYSSSQLGSLGNNTASSIQVGSNVRAILYDFSSDLTSPEVTSRIETFESSDTSLADNFIGDNHVSGVLVQARPLDATHASQLEPFLTTPGNTDGIAPTAIDSLVLAWEGGEGANQFRSEIRKQSDNSLVRLLDWQYTYSWSIGNLPAGNYSWSVTARNSAYPAVTNNTSINFSVLAGSLPAGTAKNAPVSESFENGQASWTPTGLWRMAQVEMGNRPQTYAWQFNNGTNYKDTIRRGGDLTSPPYFLPAGAEYYLRFSSYSKVEDGNPYWDQRRVQLSIDDGPFFDLYQFMDDWQEGPVWIDSPAIKLVNASGQPVSNARVRIRFHFNTIDEDYNAFWGWMIDNLSISSTPPDLSCADDNNSPQQAVVLMVGQTAQGSICPQGDVDYYAFTAFAGQIVQVDLDANPNGLTREQNASVSLLDSYIFLLDSTGKNVIMENDDEIPNSDNKDSRMTYIIQRDGVYYVKVRAWDHPGAGGSQYYYSLKLLPYMGDGHLMFLPVLSR
jgi:hypothetical protein